MSTTRNRLSAEVIAAPVLAWDVIRSEQVQVDYVLKSRVPEFMPPNRSQATRAQPGSTEKLRVMTERYSTGQPLHHPRDATCLADRLREFNLQGL